jgi:site-specific recombinase XerD
MTKKYRLTFNQALNGYLLNCDARGLSDHTIHDYKNSFRLFKEHLKTDMVFEEITSQHIKEFLASREGVTNNTLRHYYSAFAAMWTWAIKEEIVTKHIVNSITAPKPEQREIVPFTQAEFKALLGVVSKSKAYSRPGKRVTDHTVIHPERTRAILLMLLDTGLRCGELTSLKLVQLDQRNQRVQVMGKGALERSVPFSPRTGQALWRYLSTRPDATPGDPLFATYNNRPIAPTQLNKSIRNLGKKAGVTNVHPHRFRHTFAIQYLRNGGDPYTLQKLMGHSTLDMVKRYLALAQIDIDRAHKRASPVDNWTL